MTKLRDAPSFKIAFRDADFLERPEVRSYRLALEYAKPQLAQQEMNVNSTLVVFGSARIPSPEASAAALTSAREALDAAPDDDAAQAALARAEKLDAMVPFYQEARRFAAGAACYQTPGEPYDFVVTTGGGPGIMEAANRGAFEAGLKTMAFNIEIPHEQDPNPYVTPELCFNFHYFAIRKMHFLLRARAMAAFPGGYGTMDELFETLTLIQTGKMERIPIVLFGRDWWSRFMRIESLVEAGTISLDDPDLVKWVDTAEEGWAAIEEFYGEESSD
ncbi:MAG: hypothetical protein GKS06_10480 [Acidobacteria bacterium]|nr:hypothetical protein [Acidobacteriota bacterium]